MHDLDDLGGLESVNPSVGMKKSATRKRSNKAIIDGSWVEAKRLHVRYFVSVETIVMYSCTPTR